MDAAPVPAAPIRAGHWLALDAFAAAAFIVLLYGTSGLAVGGGNARLWPRVAVAVALGLPVALRRVWPLAVVGFLLAGPALMAAAGRPPGAWPFLPVAFVVYLVAATRHGRVPTAVLLLAVTDLLMVTLVNIALARPPSPSPAVAWLTAAAAALAVVAAWTIGCVVRMTRTHAAGVSEQQQRRVLAELERAQHAVTRERLAIARDLHDVIAHSMSVITVRAGIGRHLIDSEPAEARDALAVIEATGRQALAEIRRLLGVFRDQDAPASLTAPGLAALDELVGHITSAGVTVHVQVTGAVRELPSDVDLAAYRVVQEALTNVVRHSGASACWLTLVYRDEEVFIDVTDHGRGSSGQQPAASSRGHGITGMGERVTMHGGLFSAAPLLGGGFRVTATIPSHGGPR